MHSQEHWIEIENFPKYAVSNTGLVKNQFTGKILRANLSGRGRGHLAVCLYDETGPHTKYVHQLVVEAFIGDIPDDLEVNHIDGNHVNNHVSNLEIITHIYNCTHAYSVGLRAPVNPAKKVRCVETNEIFSSVNAAAEAFNTIPTHISAVIHGRQQTTRGYSFELVNSRDTL